MNFHNSSDEELALLALRQPECYDFLILRHRLSLINFIYFKYTRSLPEAEDIVQEAHIKAYINLASFDATRKWKTWLFRIAINVTKSFLNKIKTLDSQCSLFQLRQ